MFIVLTIFSFLLNSCVNWENKDESSTILTVINVQVIARDISTDAPLQNQVVYWSIHLYNGTTNTDSNLENGQVTTDTNGEATIPAYQCQLNPNTIARVIASTPDQANNMITPMTVSYDDIKDIAIDATAIYNISYYIRK